MADALVCSEPLGRVTWSRPPDPQEGNTFRIVPLDTRSHLKPGFIAVT
ncbi:hypothetical protein [Actinoplanes solisilvae]|nr:hypothetical protein [Actinoplanes solisilvae]